MANNVRLVRAEFETAVKYLTKEGFVNSFPITFEYSKEEYIVVQVGFKIIEPTEYVVETVQDIPTVTFTNDLPVGVYVTLRSRSDSTGVPHTYHYTGNAKGQSEFNQKTMDENFEYLDRIVEEVNDSAELTMDSLAGFEDTFGEVQSTSEEAIRIANAASSTANTALGTANSANTTANSASNTANGAASTANEASVTAGEAKATATSADTKATTALGVSNSAEGSASNALTLATQANTTADNALTIATSAKDTAEGIEAKADQAIETADNASNVATDAKDTATGIAGVANDALDTAVNANEKAQEALDKAIAGGVTLPELESMSTGTGNWTRESHLVETIQEAVDVIPKPDLTEYRKLDNYTFTQGKVTLKLGETYGDIETQGNGFIFKGYTEGNPTPITWTTPTTGGELALKSQVDTKWDIQTTTGTGNVARMSEVDTKADSTYVNTELGKKRDYTDSIFTSIRIQTDKGSSRYGLSAVGIPFISVKAGTGTEYFANFQNKTGTVAYTSDIPSLSGYATQSWVTGQGYTTLATANANSTKLGAEQRTQQFVGSNFESFYNRVIGGVPRGSVITGIERAGSDNGFVLYRPITRL